MCRTLQILVQVTEGVRICDNLPRKRIRDSVEQHHTHIQPYYGPFSRTTQMSRCQKKSEDYGAREDNRGRHAGHPAGRHSIRTNQQPTSIIALFLCQMPFLTQPSHIILAWDRHQICWLAYSVWCNTNHVEFSVMRSSQTLDSFRQHLKTHLFHSVFNNP